MNRQWIHCDRRSEEYKNGVKSFIEFAKQNVNEENETVCPCSSCGYSKLKTIDVVHIHLLQHGLSVIFETYFRLGSESMPSPVQEPATEPNNDIFDMMDDMLDRHDSIDQPIEGGEDTLEGDDIDKVQRVDGDNYDKLLVEAQRELFPGCTEYTVLTFVVELLSCKVDNLWTNKSVERNLQIMRKMCPKPNNIPESYYACKKMLKDLGLGYENIHACKYDCVLFYKEHEGKDKCPVCNEPRYKNSDSPQKKKIPKKILRYFPLTPRLQRLFKSRHTAGDMRWHKDKRVDEEGKMRHPADGSAWKDFDISYPDFAQDPRNVRLGLATDGFNPFGNMSLSYSMWPVVVVPYNLPPWMCMKKAFSMLTLLIPGPISPGRDIDVYLRPLIDELKELWDHGAKTYDKMAESDFNMRAAVMWTINDFPTYANLSGWSTKGYLACPVCNKDTASHRLKNKIGYGVHRRFLPMHHSWRKDTSKKTFTGKREMRKPPVKLSGKDILKQLRCLRPSKPGII
ncbi:uncharacterized protein LOC121049185 [Rosa chinensis]|uniref:uncharacterized protein LOC121049185 n=1 Tax=Rosa chinensis TaxID=74649 RepID=UPI001AD8C364|nr:uncharacterized protein LOC121049185 [Rosa chinensis]